MTASMDVRPQQIGYVSSAVVSVTARVLAEVNGIDEGTGRELVRRVVSPGFWRWQARVRGAGFCTRPVRVAGQRFAHTGDGRRELLYSTAAEPDRVLLIRCGNRRASVCPPCSREYKGDVWQLLRAGTAGGSKGVPESVGSHPMWFVTLTGPGFGSVHGAGCGRGRRGASASERRGGRAGDPMCPHGRGRACPVMHVEDDPAVGEPVCPDCYDYPGAVAFNWAAPELWRRFTIALKRRLAARLGVTETRLGKRVRVSYAKVAEFQRRGVVHFHAIIRIDGAGDDYPAVDLAGLDEAGVAAVIRSSVGDVAVTAATGEASQVTLGFGEQIDIRPIRHAPPTDVGGDPGGGDQDDGGEQAGDVPVTSGMVAAYIAKYATKAAEDFGLDSRIRSSAAARDAGLRPHIATMILTGERLARLDGYAGLGRWLHMLGFRGHFTTKSRRFSVTLGSLRQARRDHQARRDTSPNMPTRPGVPTASTTAGPAGAESPLQQLKNEDVEPVLVVGQWRFLGLGYTTPGDALLAAYAHTEHQHARGLARDQHRAEERP